MYNQGPLVYNNLQDCNFKKQDVTDWSSELIKEAWLDLGVKNWPDNSDLKQRILKNKKAVLEAISKSESKWWISFGIAFGITLFIVICILIGA